MTTQEALAERLRSLVNDTPWFMRALQAVAQLDLPSCCIGAGAVRNLVWDALHGFEVPSALSDIDVAYFDAGNLQPQCETQLRERLEMLSPGMPWEVCNQAGVHLWFEAYFGYAVSPLLSLEDAIASWPDYATAVGVYLEANGNINIIAPYGLDDLFNMLVRHNPVRISADGYARRLVEKYDVQRWPRLTIIR
ncbi:MULTISPECIES: nucleotidyltransferase family protein [unclassified Janthinobacterium]|uniref:nucleotidyltransferase family protein n=1 Tax=unclassified Janthinobacterium TaxID=2610881 RepID=UPI00183C4249|nr:MULTISPECIES: nucleotidyltransferase family protein [unclassified Janthinobacterium]MBB5370715.1 hypothetical protein [Janthinobacterium sp. K2C7]MBB5383521.1 hypothetical protein [Janthinobacterium sp. K2Li3]MBB5388975.1 hypothetical protein [Janthinobacterium sp. K2E3]